jgi:TRAP-type uncharacterized transport system fused permease subunit
MLGNSPATLLSFVRKEDRLDIKSFISTLEDGPKAPFRGDCMRHRRVVIGMMGATGIALKVGDVILSFTKGNLLLTLISTMISP